MAAPRRFDHDEARRLRAEGLTLEAIAARMGVTHMAVLRVVDAEFRDRQQRYKTAWSRRTYRVMRPCPDCGVDHPVWLHMVGRGYNKGRCKACADKAATHSVRPNSLRCVSCREWKPDEAFSPSRQVKRRRGRHAECKSCASVRRRAERARKRVAA